jgi:hypothetical protein
MKRTNFTIAVAGIALSILFILPLKKSMACSTFKLQNGKNIVYGHNLNQGVIGVPG